MALTNFSFDTLIGDKGLCFCAGYSCCLMIPSPVKQLAVEERTKLNVNYGFIDMGRSRLFCLTAWFASVQGTLLHMAQAAEGCQ